MIARHGKEAHELEAEVHDALEREELPEQAFSLPDWQRFCREVVRPAAQHTDETGEISEEIWSGLCDHGYLQLFHDEPEPGRPSASPLWPAMLALAEACPSTFWKATISSALCGRMIARFASMEMQERWVGELAAGRCVGAFAASEGGSGSDPASYQARLTRRGHGWVLTGCKERISNACDATVAAVLAPAFDEAGAALGLALAVVELHAASVTRARHATMGLRGMELGRITFEETPLPASAVRLGAELAKLLVVLEWGQLVQAVSGLGAGLAALAEAERFLVDRYSFGRPLSGHPVPRAHLAEARRELGAGAALARSAVEQKARGAVVGDRAMAAKIFCSEAGVAAAQVALRVCGGWGYTRELAVERLLRDAHGSAPAGLPNDRLRELLVAPRLGADAWARLPHAQARGRSRSRSRERGAPRRA